MGRPNVQGPLEGLWRVLWRISYSYSYSYSYRGTYLKYPDTYPAPEIKSPGHLFRASEHVHKVAYKGLQGLLG